MVLDVTDAHAIRLALEVVTTVNEMAQGTVHLIIDSQGLDVVLHAASFGMSGKEMRQKAQIENVNVCGTVNIVSACCDAAVPALVYTRCYLLSFW